MRSGCCGARSRIPMSAWRKGLVGSGCSPTMRSMPARCEAPTRRRIRRLKRLLLTARCVSGEADLLADMRIVLAPVPRHPGGHTPIFPYESAFLHVERG